MMDINCEVNCEYRCPVEYTLRTIGGKWKPLILWSLAQSEVLRYGQLKKTIDGITHKMLSQQLKDLEEEGLVNRKQYNQVPPKVEYSLTKRGKTVIPILDEMCKWGRENMTEDEKAKKI